MKNEDIIRPIGDVEMIINYKNGETKYIDTPNTVLLSGRRALTSSIAGDIGESYQFFINRMLFGDGGTHNGVKKYVDAGREGLFGVTQVSKPVLANIDGNIPTQAIFNAVIKYDEAVGITLNEMALQMANGDLYSMTTFPDLNKTEDMQITFNWRINYI